MNEDETTEAKETHKLAEEREKETAAESEELGVCLPNETEQSKEAGSKPRTGSSSLLVGVVIIFMVCVFDATSISCLQLMKQLPPDIQINALNFSFGFVCIATYFLIKRSLPRLAKANIPWVMAICVVFLVDCLTLYNQEASFLPLGSIGSIGYAFNIIFSVILSKIFLTELMTVRKGIALLMTLFGLVLTVLAHIPSLGTPQGRGKSCVSANGIHDISSNLSASDVQLFPLSNVTSESLLSSFTTREFGESIDSNFTLGNSTQKTMCVSGPKHQKDFWSQLLSMCLLCISCFCSALETVMLSGSRLKHESVPVITFWVFASGCFVLFPATFLFEKPIIPQNWTDGTFLFTYCVCAAGLTYCYIRAAQLLMPMFLTVIESFGVPLMFVVQMLFLIQIAKPNNIWLQMTGVLLVFAATVSLPVIEYMAVKKIEKDQKHKRDNELAESG